MLDRVTAQFDSARIEALSDGVFAIAITLLVLEISVPEDAYDDLLRAILDQWPSYLAYVTSFLTIGMAWFIHHAIFRRMRLADATVLRLNLLLLMVVSFLPFPTRLLAEAVDNRAAERTAVFFYGGILVAMLLLLAALARYVASRESLLHESARATELRNMSLRLTPGLGVYAGVFFVALAAPRLAAFGFVLVAIGTVFILGDRGERL
jgi:uncharacterized membrane protein